MTTRTDAEPLTAAGKALLRREDFNERSFALITAEAIIAIETEAARLNVDRLKAALHAVEHLPKANGAVVCAHAPEVAAYYEKNPDGD